MSPHKQCDSSHCREVDVQLGVVSQRGSTQAVWLLPLSCGWCSAWGGESVWVHTSSVTPPTVVRLMFSMGWRVSVGPHKQCDPSHCREVDVQLGVASQRGSTQAV